MTSSLACRPITVPYKYLGNPEQLHADHLQELFPRNTFEGKGLQAQLTAPLSAGLFPGVRSWVCPEVCPCPGVSLCGLLSFDVSFLWHPVSGMLRQDSPLPSLAKHRALCSSSVQGLCWDGLALLTSVHLCYLHCWLYRECQAARTLAHEM